jgi:hypothetical protein
VVDIVVLVRRLDVLVVSVPYSRASTYSGRVVVGISRSAHRYSVLLEEGKKDKGEENQRAGAKPGPSFSLPGLGFQTVWVCKCTLLHVKVKNY